MSRENIDDAKLTAPAPKLNPPTPAPKLIGPLRFLLKRPFLNMFYITFRKVHSRE